jgi:hypothetical protein
VDPDDDEELEEEQDDKPAARVVRGSVSKMERDARMEGYRKGYEEAYRVARQCSIAGLSLKASLAYLQHGYTLEDASEDIAERRAKESERTAIHAESMPDTGTITEPPRKVITGKDRLAYTANFNRKQDLPKPRT